MCIIYIYIYMYMYIYIYIYIYIAPQRCCLVRTQSRHFTVRSCVDITRTSTRNLLGWLRLGWLSIVLNYLNVA